MTKTQQVALRVICLLAVVLVVGLTWLYLPSFAFSVMLLMR